MRSRSTARRIAGWLLAGAVLSAGSPSAGDPVVARTLMQSGKAALERKQLDEAMSYLTKARDEDPMLAEAHYWMAVCRERAGDPAASLVAYREFRSVAAAAAGEGRSGKNDADLVKKAQARIAAMAPGEAEDDKLRAQLVVDLLAIARAKEKDPAAAGLALEALLRAEPEHADAPDMLGQVRSPALKKGEVPLAPPLQGLVGWKDLIFSAAFNGIAGIKYEPPGLTVDTRDPQLTTSPSQIRPGVSFGLDMELKLVKGYDKEWRLGFSMLPTKDRQATLVVSEKRVSMLAGSVQGFAAAVADAEVPRIDEGSWHRLNAVVERSRVVVWFDGRRTMHCPVDGLGPESTLGLYSRACRAEIRTLRWIPVE